MRRFVYCFACAWRELSAAASLSASVWCSAERRSVPRHAPEDARALPQLHALGLVDPGRVEKGAVAVAARVDDRDAEGVGRVARPRRRRGRRGDVARRVSDVVHGASDVVQYDSRIR